MYIILAILAAVFLGLFAVALTKGIRLRTLNAQHEAEIAVLKQESESLRAHYEAEASRIEKEAQAVVADALKKIDLQLAELKQESVHMRRHYENEVLQIHSTSEAALANALRELSALRKYQGIIDAEVEAQRLLADALKEATELRAEAQKLLDQSRAYASEERTQANQKAKENRAQADALLNHATRDAGRIVEEAHKRAEQIAGDAYTALRDKDRLEQAAKAIRNIIDGYGDRYIIPTRSLIDDLAADFGHTEAGQALAAAREHTRRMVELGQAAECDYAESNRRDTAVRFVTDAFNGRVEAILSNAKHDNYGTLEQQIRDAFSLVNQNGAAFRNARILPAFLDARLAELKWTVMAQELRLKEREEQRRLKEQIREEEKARREYERTIQEAQKEEALIKQALEKARAESEQANAEQRTQFQKEIDLLNQRLAEAEAKGQRAMSMAQQTRAGNVYIISNIGSFGEEVFKIGMTRRQEPLDRIDELGDASVPFDFDVHAMIRTDDAPALEQALHQEFDDLRVNKVNFRKEFFRLPVERLRAFVATKGIDAAFTMVADAREYRETQALEKMTPEQRQKYYQRMGGEI